MGTVALIKNKTPVLLCCFLTTIIKTDRTNKVIEKKERQDMKKG